MTPQQVVARNLSRQSIPKRGSAGRTIAYQVAELSRAVKKLGDDKYNPFREKSGTR